MLVVVDIRSFSLGPGAGVGVVETVGMAVGACDVHPDSAATVTIAIIAMMERLITLFDSIIIAT
jgi:hypothetical protein